MADEMYFFAFCLSVVSLQQMVLFGQNPSQGTLLKASQFLAEELPIRLSHRVKELDELPDGLAEMDGVRRVKEWYAESFNVGRINSTHSAGQMTDTASFF